MDKEQFEELFSYLNWPPDEKILQQPIQDAEDVVPQLLEALEERDKVDGSIAIDLLGLIGYPANEPALTTIVQYLGADINDPRYLSAFETVFHMEPDVVVPYLIQELLGKGEHYDGNPDYKARAWAYEVEGICGSIGTDSVKYRVDQQFALRCCPAINALLLQADPALERTAALPEMLRAIERAGETVDYVIPALVALIKRTPEDKIRQKAQRLLTMFKPETLADYKFLLAPDQ